MKRLITKTTIILLIIAAISFIGHLFIYPSLPDQIPIQWASDGSVNTYGNKYMDLVLAGLPAIIIVLMTFMPYLDPRKANYKKHSHAYNLILTGITVLLILCSWLSALSGLGYKVSITTLIPLGIGILFIIIGNIMPQIRSNYFLGIRTPWTLENADVWRKTHKFGGIIFIIEGLFFIISAFFRSVTLVNYIIAPLIILSIIALYIYSYAIYKKLQR